MNRGVGVRESQTAAGAQGRVVLNDGMDDDGRSVLEVHAAAEGHGAVGHVVPDDAVADQGRAAVAVDAAAEGAGVVVRDDATADLGRGVLDADAAAVLGRAPADGETVQHGVAAFAVGEGHDGPFLGQAPDQRGLRIDGGVRGVGDVAAAERDRLALEVDLLHEELGDAVPAGLGDQNVAVVGVVDRVLQRRVEFRGVVRVIPGVEDPAQRTAGNRGQGLGRVDAAVRPAQARRDLVRGLHQDLLDLHVRQGRILRPQQRSSARDMGRRDGGSGQPAVSGRHAGRGHRSGRRGRQSAQDALARLGEVHRLDAVVRRQSQLIPIVRRQDRDDVVQIVAGRVDRGVVAVERIVAGRGDEEDSLLAGGLDGVVQTLAVLGTAPGGVDDLGALGGGVLDRRHGGVQLHAVVVGDLADHQAEVPANAGNSHGIIPGGSDNARHIGPVVDVVGRGSAVAHEVIPVDVVDVAVVVVVGVGLAAGLLAVAPEAVLEVRVRGVDARVENGDDNVLAPRSKVPGFGGVDIGIGEPAGLADVVQGPLLREVRIVGRPTEVVPVIGLGIENVRARRELHHGVGHRGPLRQRHQSQAGNDLVILAIHFGAGHDPLQDLGPSGPLRSRPHQIGAAHGRTVAIDKTNEQGAVPVGGQALPADGVR